MNFDNLICKLAEIETLNPKMTIRRDKRTGCFPIHVFKGG